MAELTQIEQYVIGKVREKRVKAGISQVVLSNLIDASDKFVGNVESGKSKHKYNLNHLNKLAFVLECSVKDFIPDQPL